MCELLSVDIVLHVYSALLLLLDCSIPQTCLCWTAGHEDSISMGCLDGAGRRLLTISFDKTARVWDIRSGRCLAVLQHEGQLVRGCIPGRPCLQAHILDA